MKPQDVNEQNFEPDGQNKFTQFQAWVHQEVAQWHTYKISEG